MICTIVHESCYIVHDFGTFFTKSPETYLGPENFSNISLGLVLCFSHGDDHL